MELVAEIAEGCGGTAENAVTARLRAVPVPHAFTPETLMLPLLLPVVALMEMLADVPDQPEGSDQL